MPTADPTPNPLNEKANFHRPANRGFAHGNRLLILCISLLAACCVARRCAAQETTVELMAAEVSWSDTEFVGHAFMCIGVPLNNSIKEECFGFYPTDGGKAAVGGPGEVVSEFERNPARFSKVTVSLKRAVTDEQRRAIYGLIGEWNKKEYDLTDQSCIDFVASVAKAMGLKTPKRSPTELPAAYLEKLNAINAE